MFSFTVEAIKHIILCDKFGLDRCFKANADVCKAYHNI